MPNLLLNIKNRALSGGDESREFYSSVLKELNVSWKAEQDELALIPRKAPLLVVANHPHGLPDGLILGAILSIVRGDVKFLANSLLTAFAAFNTVIPVNPFEEDSATADNVSPVREALRWLHSGGVLVVFPAGEVAALNLSTRRIEEPQWKSTAARLALKTGATVLPVHQFGLMEPMVPFFISAGWSIRACGRRCSLGN